MQLFSSEYAAEATNNDITNEIRILEVLVFIYKMIRIYVGKIM